MPVTVGAKNFSVSNPADGASPFALAVEQMLKHVERAFLAAGIALAILDEVAVFVRVLPIVRVEGARVLHARELAAKPARGGVISELARHQEADSQPARVRPPILERGYLAGMWLSIKHSRTVLEVN